MLLDVRPPDSIGSRPHLDIFFRDHQMALFDSTARFVALGGGARNGKSTAAIVKVRTAIMEKPNSHWWVGRFDATEFDRSTFIDWFRIFPQDKRFFNHTKKILKLPNGSIVDFIHLSDTDHLTNATLDGFWIEQAEEVTAATFNFLRLRLSKEGAQGLITFNPKGEDWIYWLFGTNAELVGMPHGTKHHLTGRTYKDCYHLIMASTDDNAVNLAQDYIDDLDELPDDIASRMRHGRFDRMGGKVYKEFRHDIHIIEPFEIPTWWNAYRAIDWGTANYFVCLWPRINAAGDIFISREYYAKEKLVSEHAKIIKQMDDPGVRLISTILDSACWAKTLQDKRRPVGKRLYSIADEFSECGLPCRPAQKNIEMGIERVRKYLWVDPSHVHPLQADVKGAPRLYIFNTCPNLIRQLMAYRRPELTGRTMLNHDPDEKPIHKDCDGPDALRYFIMSRPSVSQLQEPTPPGSVKEMIDMIEDAEMIENRRRN